MITETYSWVSRCTASEMVVERYGDRGRPMVYVPTSEGDHHEFERRGTHSAVRPWIADGRLQFFAIDGWGPKSWFDDRIEPAERVRRYAAFERYTVDELLPWVTCVTGRSDLAACGAGYGAMVCANWILKPPGPVTLACSLGGRFGMWHRLDGYHDLDVYFHTPLEYLPRLADPQILGAIRATSGIELCTRIGDPAFDESERLRRALHDRGIPHRWSVEPSRADAPDPWWHQPLRAFLARRFGDDLS